MDVKVQYEMVKNVNRKQYFCIYQYFYAIFGLKYRTYIGRDP
jgi:hypothetical protein